MVVIAQFVTPHMPYAGRRWVFATGRRGVVNGRLPAHFV